MEWLGKKMYPKARAYERRSRMQVVYLMAILILLVAGAVAGGLWFLNTPVRR
jgi:hypothetical protein